MDPSGSSPDRPSLVVVGPEHPGPVDLDTGAGGREEAAIAVAVVAASRPTGTVTVRTAEPRAARRAAHVVAAIVAARPEDRT